MNTEAKKITSTPNVIITKGVIGGASIDVCVKEPVYEDMGSYTYKTEKLRDADFNELISLNK